jgi:predicted TIM-barrel fold metal-dependent hydrolase
MTTVDQPLFDEVESLRGIKIIDVDTHLTEPGDIWTSRAPKEYAELVPRIVATDDLGPAMMAQVREQSMLGQTSKQSVWVVGEGTVLGPAGSGSVINRQNEKVRGSIFMEWPLGEGSAAASFVAPRVAMMDALGVYAQVIYPNVVGFGGQNFALIPDVKLRNLCATLWNDAMAENQEESGGRLFGMAMLPWWDVEASVREIERVHGLGLKGVVMSADPQVAGLPDLAERHWDPVWEALQACSLPLNFHVGASATQRSYFGTTPWPSFSDDKKLAVGSAMLQLGNARILANIIYSGICDRFPRLKIVSVESGIGWIPFFLEGLDYQATESDVELELRPSEYFRRQMYACFWYEGRAGQKFIDDVRAVGVENCMFETDFPHPTCLYPEPIRHVAPTLELVDHQTREKLLSTNAAHVYNIDIS